MPQALIRQFDKEVMERLKQPPRKHGRSLQSESKTILEEPMRDYEHA